MHTAGLTDNVDSKRTSKKATNMEGSKLSERGGGGCMWDEGANEVICVKILIWQIWLWSIFFTLEYC